MPSDPETNRALGEVTTAVGYVGEAVKDLATKIDTVAEAGRTDIKELQTRIESNAQDTRSRLHNLRNDLHVKISGLDNDITEVSTKLDIHLDSDAREFNRIHKALDAGQNERVSIWRIVVGIAASGGIGAALARWIGERS